MNEYLSKFQQLLRELFQFDSADLDFGIYRIMNHKRDVVERFIAQDLPKAVSDELEKDALAAQSQATRALEEARRNVLETLGEDAIDAEGRLAEAYHATKVGKEYLAAQAQAKSARSREALEAAVYNHLYTFFSRYYQDGDFISKRRYSKKERYAIPYNGEEVHLYWANHDQYYIKTSEYFVDYTWKAPNGVTVHFKLKAADVEQNNVKGEKRFFLPRPDEVEFDAKARALIIPFEFRPLTVQENIAYGQKNQQEAIITKALEEIPRRISPKHAPEALAALETEKRRTDDGRIITHLEHHLRRYTRRNTSDFFIHKDLRGFLSRELDFYLKNEVLNLEEMEAVGEDLAEGWFQLLRLIKRVGNHIIEFLAQIEDFQKLLWEKKKFITETCYVIAVGNIPEEFYPEIAACEAQWQEWEKLLGIEIPPSPHRGEGRGEGRKSRTKEERNALIKQFAREMRKAPTDAEKRLWHFLRDRRLGGFKFRRQHPVGSYIADFVCIEAGVIVELDGGQHAENDQREKDEQRTRFFESRGFRVWRFWNHDVLARTAEVLAAILDALEMAPHPNPLPNGEREEFLRARPSLPLDTRHFSPDFTDRLLARYDDLDGMTDGLLVHSENWQALNLLQEKYRQRVKCVYIDPPFNSPSTEILYKNDYPHSSWLALLQNRIVITQSYLKEGIYVIAIDENEQERLGMLLRSTWLSNYKIVCVSIRHNPRGIQGKNFSYCHEYAYFIYPSDERKYIGGTKREETDVRNLRDSGTESDRADARNCFYPIIVKNGQIIGFGEVTDDDYHPKGSNEKLSNGSVLVWPIDTSGREKKWRYARQSVEQILDNLEVRETRGKYEIYFAKDVGTVRTIWDDAKFDASEYGTKLLQQIFGTREIDFSFPKSLYTLTETVRITTPKGENILLDYVAGSGTTGHAVINLNREDGGRRKFILVEMADYFDTVLLPRIKKVTFSPEWKDGKPKRMATQEEFERGPRIVKVIRIESYEDALNNIAFDEEGGQMTMQFEDYPLQYMLKWETRHSETLLNVEELSKPFEYGLHIYRDGETRVQKVDLPETFNYLIGLDVAARRVLPSPNGRGAGGEGRYLVYRGVTREGQCAAVIWRETKGWTKEDYERDRDFVAAQKLTEGADLIYVNGDSLIPGARALEGVFKARMFAGVGA